MTPAARPDPAGPRRPDVALYLTNFDRGGVATSLLQLAQGFLDAGLEVDLVVNCRRGPMSEGVPRRARVVDLSGGAPRHGSVPARLLALVRYQREHRPRVMLSKFWHLNLMVVWATRLSLSGTRVFPIAENDYRAQVGDMGRAGRLFPWLARLTFPRAHGLIGISEGASRGLAELSGLAPDRVLAIPNPSLPPGAEQRAAAPPAHPWLEESVPPVVLAVGRLARQKDYPTLLEAFARLRRRRPVRLLVLGEGQERGALEARISELGLEDDVVLAGQVDDPLPSMARAAVMVLSSRYEGLANVLVEALSVGCPVVATDCPSGPREVLDDGRYGTLVPVGDPGALAEALDDTLRSPPPRELCREGADRFSPRRIVPRYLEAVGLAAPPGPPPA